ncbi:MAG: hypothetical protein U1E45_18565 [Geminicoccaceae bacterium]
MTETRAVARLPQLDIEILHRENTDGRGEALQITLTGRPNLDAAAALFDPYAMLQVLAAFNPWLAAWMRLAAPPVGRLTDES